MEYITMKNSSDSKLKMYSTCSIRIRSRKQDILEKPQQHNSDQSEKHEKLFDPVACDHDGGGDGVGYCGDLYQICGF